MSSAWLQRGGAAVPSTGPPSPGTEAAQLFIDQRPRNSELPGRTERDVEAFVEDYEAKRIHARPCCIVTGADSTCMRNLPLTALPRARPVSRPSFLLARTLGMPSPTHSQVGGYAQVASWAGCSGAVIMMAAVTGGALSGGLYTCLAGSATETDPSRQRPGLQDPYNRSGELVALQLDGSRLGCRVLDAHSVVHSDGRVMRSTVSCVVHSETNSAYVTAGFDGSVAVWSDDQLSLLARLGPHGCPVNALAADTRTYGLLYGTAHGELIWCADPLGSPALHKLGALRVADGQALPLANSVDVVAIASRARSCAYAGYGYLTTLRTGAVHAYDLAALQPVDIIKLPHDRSLTDMALHPQESLLATATGVLVDDKAAVGDGCVRLYDLRALGTAPLTISTGQTDMHRVAFSPCGALVYTNDAASGQMLVHDLRHTSRPLWAHNHSKSTGTPADDHHLGFAWLPHILAGLPAGLLMTGGSDSALCFWDLRRPEPLIEQHDLGQPINNITVSADASHVWAGTEVGSLHLLSRNAGVAALGDDMHISYDRSEPLTA